MTTTRIAGIGRYAPGEPIDNDELVELTGIELNKERLEDKLGIRRRHIAHLRGIDETSADFAERAAREAIDDAGISPEEVGIFVVGSDTPEYISPSTAVLIQGRIQGGPVIAIIHGVDFAVTAEKVHQPARHPAVVADTGHMIAQQIRLAIFIGVKPI